MSRTQHYRDYTWEQFQFEYSVMATVLYIYYVGFGAVIWQAGVMNEQPGRIEMGDQGFTVEDLEPDELRKRMWWRKAFRNFRTTFEDFEHHRHLQSLPDTEGLAEWFELPERLRT
jgi:hypothetical protein